jgi:hypothetical protein
MSQPMNGQYALFGGLCPACGEVPAYVGYKRRVTRLLKCVICDQPVKDLSCGCADVGREGPGGNRGLK